MNQLNWLKVTLVGGAIALLSACAGSGSIDPVNVGSAELINKISCSKIIGVSNEVSKIAAEPMDSLDRSEGLDAWGINPTDKNQLELVKAGLKNRAEKCASASTSPGASAAASASPPADSDASPPSDGGAGVEDSDGERVSLPLADDTGPPINGDSTGDPRTPPSLNLTSYGAMRECGPMAGWDQLVDCVEEQGDDLQWYIDAVNDRKAKTRFDWDDVIKWASTKTAAGKLIDARVIEVYNLRISDIEARSRVRSLAGDDVDQMPVARFNTCTVNTRGFGHERVQNFVDCRKMVRVSLAPLVFDQGDLVGLKQGVGIFVDCLNIHWIPRQVVKHGPPPVKTAPPTKAPPVVKTPRTPVVEQPRPKPTVTKSPRPSPSKTRPAKEKCPYNPELDKGDKRCLKPKSDDPKDYPGVPPGKPTRPPVSEAPKSSPDPVETERPSNGGHGPTDSATRQPGSETGGQAPGASPAGEERHDPPPPQEGANSPSNDENAPAEGGNDQEVSPPPDW